MEESNSKGFLYVIIFLLIVAVGALLFFMNFDVSLNKEEKTLTTTVEPETLESEIVQPEEIDEEDETEDAVEDKIVRPVQTNVVQKTSHSITITSPSKNLMTFTVAPVTFKGSVSEGAKKIQVIAKGEGNSHADSYSDDYFLENFKAGDTEFSYRAAKKWDNMDLGRNDYEFIAHFEDGSVEKNKISLNYIYDGKGEVNFDSCGGVDKYDQQWWYADMKARLYLNGTKDKAGEISEICYSDNFSMAIVITGVNGICAPGSIWRYFVHSKTLEDAGTSKNPWLMVCPAELREFGKRSGNIIPVSGRDDIGCLTANYSYDFVNNLFWLKNNTDSCGTDRQG